MISKPNFFSKFDLIFLLITLITVSSQNIVLAQPSQEQEGHLISYNDAPQNVLYWVSEGRRFGLNSISQQGDATPTPAVAPPVETPEPVFTPSAASIDENQEAPLPRTGASSYYVNGDTGNNNNSCTSIEDPCKDIQETVNKAAAWDAIFVTSGTYTFSTNGSPNVVIIDKNITLSGGWDASFASQTGASTIDGAYANNGILALTGTVIVENFIIQNTMSGNSGAIYIVNGNFTLRNSTLRNNVASSNGAGIFLDNGVVTVINSTISNNTAGGSGAGIYASNNLGTFVTIKNSTIVFNSASTGGGISRTNGTYIVTNSIIANNSASISAPDCNGTVLTANYNIIENMSGCTITNPGVNLNVDPAIDSALTTEIMVHALMPGSPAINGGDPDVTKCQANDQRGVIRPQFGRCDIGSYEYDTVGAPSVIQISSGSPQTAIISTTFGDALAAVVEDEFGIPVSGVTVTFTAPESGASGVFTDTSNNVTTATTNASGIATAPSFTGNHIAGSYVVDATTPEIATPAQFQLQNYSPTPSSISVIAGSSQTTHINTNYTIALKVLVEDQFSNPMPNVSVTFTAPIDGASGTFADTLDSTTTASTNASGFATAPVFTANSNTGEFTLTASVAGIANPASFQLANYNGLYVSTTGSDSSSCIAPTSPCATINAAILKAKSGDSIQITEGIYTSSTGTAVVTITKDVTLSGGWNEAFTTRAAYTTVDGQNARGGINNSSAVTSSISRFHVTNGNTASLKGDGINTYGTFTITDSFIHHNTGIGIYSQSGTLTINNSSIHSNVGIGISFSNTLNLNNSTVSSNTGKGIYNFSGTGNINNSTITLNGATGIYSYLSAPIYLKNSILANNKGGTDFYPPYPQQDCYGTITSQGNNIIGIITEGCSVTGASNNNVGVNPQLGTFLPFKGYQPIMVNSPAVNGGDATTCIGSSDQRSMPRVGICDIGAYEYTPPSAMTAAFIVSGDGQSREIGKIFNQSMLVVALDSAGNPVPGVSFSFTAPLSGASGVFSDTNANSTTAITDGGGVAAAPGFTANNILGNYFVSASTSGFDPINFHLENIGWYVAQGGSDSNSCTTPLVPCATINAAVGKAQDGDTIFITSETYTSSSTYIVSITKNIVLSGGWDGTFTTQSGFTTLDGQMARGGISSSNFSLTLDHFNIINSRPGVSAGNSTVVINNSIISNNSSFGNGGGVSLLEGSLTLNNSLISNNAASKGAGISTFNGSLTINNSTISSNIASTYGGGINFDGDYLGVNKLTVNNSTIAYNSASQGGGVYRYQYFYRPIYIKNSILANNQAEFGPDCWAPDINGYQNLVSQNSIYGNAEGCPFTSLGEDLVADPEINSNLTGEPGYYTLSPSSPAINAGNPASCLSTDQRGIARPQGPFCDIGAFEYVEDGPPAIWSIIRKNSSPTSAASVDFTVAFTKSVTGVDMIGPTFDDFTLTTTGVSDAAVSGVSGSGHTYTVTVNTGTGIGTIRLNVVDNDTIVDLGLNPLGGAGAGNGNFNTGQTYTVIEVYNLFLPLILHSP